MYYQGQSENQGLSTGVRYHWGSILKNIYTGGSMMHDYDHAFSHKAPFFCLT